MSDTKTLTKADLRQFTGSENWYRGTLNRKVLFTDGAKYVADHGGAYWLLDEIALIQPYDKAVAAEEFQLWKLKVADDRSATQTLTSLFALPIQENFEASYCAPGASSSGSNAAPRLVAPITLPSRGAAA